MSDYNSIMHEVDIMEWKKVKGYELFYEVSNTGIVRSLDRESKNGWGKIIRKGKVLKQSIDGHGYYRVKLWKNKTKKTIRVHKIVLSSFVENVNNLPHTNHKDCNKLNNNINNLEWCSASYNQKHAYENGMRKSNKETKVYCKTNNTCKKYSSMQRASIDINKNRNYIGLCIKRNIYENKEYSWELI
jgi:hypothetical protein